MKNRVQSFLYKWVAASAPTKVLYGSITQELTDMFRKKNGEYNSKKKSAEKATVDEIAEEPVPAPAVTFHDGPVPVVPSLAQFTIEELWAEIKRRGGVIEDNRLALHTVTYFD